MTETASTKNPTTSPAAVSAGESHDLIHRVCGALTALAWTAIFLWTLAPKGSRGVGAAFHAGLAWILLTGGGYFAAQTVRSFLELWKGFLTSLKQEMTCQNKEHSPR